MKKNIKSKEKAWSMSVSVGYQKKNSKKKKNYEKKNNKKNPEIKSSAN